ncbi:MAG: hypothetical protein ACUVX8_08180 [Candidatus Zipacnadales bacterium]
MKTVLCYGDSNTWGYTAATEERFPPDVRWPAVLRHCDPTAEKLEHQGRAGCSELPCM